MYKMIDRRKAKKIINKHIKNRQKPCEFFGKIRTRQIDANHIFYIVMVFRYEKHKKWYNFYIPYHKVFIDD